MLRRVLKQHREKRRQRRMAAQPHPTAGNVPADPVSSKEKDPLDVTLNPSSSSDDGEMEGPPAGT